MTLKPASELTKGLKLVFREESGFCERCVERRCRMALCEDETIARFRSRMSRIVGHNITKIERR